ncbi:Cadherin-13 [Willisornis vidua]|uniref:Cadherin-13 n=1 Tax=Willisornis vidua TaxID=1566151 RepID=A0ABQ9D2K0_9PASS|nr:Cadherin-13 [Willisornis vidua]
MRMTAFDADDASTDNALLRYNILKQTPSKPSPNMFYIDPEKGDIVTVVSPVLLDREVQDIPEGQKTSDLQNCQELDLDLVEVGTKHIVGPVGVEGHPETGIAAFTHSVVPIPDTENASLEGMEKTMESPKYELVIEAKDMGGLDVGLTGTATATILIDDKNDHPPEFTKKEVSQGVLNTLIESDQRIKGKIFQKDQYELGADAQSNLRFQATVKEGVTGVIVNLTVGDRDDPVTGAWRAVYTIINGNPGQSFEIHTNPQTNEGMLSVVKPLDYEISAFHTLLIKVENEDPLIPDIAYGPSSTATVQITVEDVNEGPVFHPNPMAVIKQENIPVGSVVLTVNATDPDTLQHQTIRYSVYKDPAGWLDIHPTNGTIGTTAVLDRESPFVQDNVYTALFLATDSGNPPATGTGTLHITLEDVNDNVPSLYPTLAKVCEDAKDLRVVVLGATDKDIYPNTDQFKFELSKQSGPEKLWRINKLNNTHAQVVLLQNLKKANYNIPISVTDSGKPPLTNNTELKLQVCSCKKSKMDCSASDALHISLSLVLLSLLSLLCKSCAQLGSGKLLQTCPLRRAWQEIELLEWLEKKPFGTMCGKESSGLTKPKYTDLERRFHDKNLLLFASVSKPEQGAG